jgi:DNA-binding transcriptional LysR family regulator
MDKLRAMRLAVAIADAGSLTAAARLEGGSLPAAVRLLGALEAELGIRLFQRTTRRVTLTDAGRGYVERCRAVIGLVQEAEADLHAKQTEPRGKLTLTAPVLFGERHIAGGVVAYLQRFPEVQVELLLLDRVVNLVEEGIDVGIRIGPLEDSSLIARHATDMPRVTVAAPSYLSRRGEPEHPRDLARHDCVRYRRAGPSSWVYQDAGEPLQVPVTGPLSVNQTVAAADACVAGLGIGNFFAYQVAPLVARGALRVLLAAFEAPPRPVNIVYPARLLPARTRLFVDFIQRHILAEQPAWQIRAARRASRIDAAARGPGAKGRRAR